MQSKMESKSLTFTGWLFGNLLRFMRRILFRILSTGKIPNHIALILDGNRRFAKKMKIPIVVGYRAAFLALLCILKYCYELGVKYVTIYAFSIDNFNRRPDEVQCLMDLMLNKVETLIKYQNALAQYGVRVHFVGNLNLLDDRLRAAAEKAMDATRRNSNIVVLVCVAYTSTDEIVRAAQECCMEKMVLKSGSGSGRVVTVLDLDKHIYMGFAPEVDILIRTSGETRLSNFQLWQTCQSLLYSPATLFPEIGIMHFVWAILNFQRVQHFLHNKNMIN